MAGREEGVPSMNERGEAEQTRSSEPARTRGVILLSQTIRSLFLLLILRRTQKGVVLRSGDENISQDIESKMKKF